MQKCRAKSEYTVGRWERSRGKYVLRKSVADAMLGQHVSRTHFYGCRNASQYSWRPRSCALSEVNCASLSNISSIAFIGDSTVSQVFMSLVLLLGGTFGRNRQIKSVLSDIAASACDDALRVTFSRSDLLIHANAVDRAFVMARNGQTIGLSTAFEKRAELADLVIVGVGHHFPALRTRVNGNTSKFFEGAVDSAMRRIQARRSGKFDPSSLVFLGSPIPQPNCAEYGSPLSDLSGRARHPVGSMHATWKAASNLNMVAERLTQKHRGTFIPIPMSAYRPDATMGRNGGNRNDCLHYCLPGPPDDWNRFVVTLLRHPEKRRNFHTNMSGARWLSPNVNLEDGRKNDGLLSSMPWWPFARACKPGIQGCVCSAGSCSSSWGCRATSLCRGELPNVTAKLGSVTARRVTILLSLVFDPRYVRGKYSKRPYDAYMREHRRIMWFKASARSVKTTLPINVLVSGKRYPEQEAVLNRSGIGLVAAPSLIPPPRWASRWHRLSFNKILALGATNYDIVIVVDNDAVLLQNMDELAHVSPPAAVFHPVGERSAITSGLLVLRPSTHEMQRAVAHLASLDYSTAQYDGGDEEFWHRFYPVYNELPLMYHTHMRIKLNKSEWLRAKMLHVVAVFGISSTFPPQLRSRVRFFV